jgi:hypothetical protein
LPFEQSRLKHGLHFGVLQPLTIVKVRPQLHLTVFGLGHFFGVVFFGFWPQEGGPAVTPGDFLGFALLEERWQPPSDQREK